MPCAYNKRQRVLKIWVGKQRRENVRYEILPCPSYRRLEGVVCFPREAATPLLFQVRDSSRP